MTIRSNPRIVVIGGGFAGMAAIASLLRRLAAAGTKADICLVDAGPGHALIPEIPHVLEKGLDIYSRILDFSTLLQGTGVRYCQRRVIGLDRRNQQVFLADDEPLHFDYALLAVGTEAAFPDVPGLHAHAWPVRTALDAIQIIKALRRKPSSRIVIAGGGFTGVELAASLKGHYVTLLERQPSLLPNMPARYGQYAHDFLESSGVDVRLSRHMVHVNASTVYTDSGDVPYDLLIWAGGIKPPHWIKESGIACGPRGYPIADSRGRIDGHLFVAGDLWQLNRPYAVGSLQTAETAQAMGNFVGRVIAAYALERRLPQPFRHSTRGIVVSLGPLRGVGWVLTPLVPLHGVLAGELKRAALFRYRQRIWHRADPKRHVS
ncbi:FAD-dependent oxidoreductase [Sulfobacillus harzensis]|uniref:FAD-dependent oxidoreductase n=1 Tax=Sulfobacillus harzensis TaxID=2729629 RepID=A0A7Y0L617_9FIRM|nr:FAD-dependent oxidoreductase [Sulfobacillus harzensis]